MLKKNSVIQGFIIHPPLYHHQREREREREKERERVLMPVIIIIKRDVNYFKIQKHTPFTRHMDMQKNIYKQQKL